MELLQVQKGNIIDTAGKKVMLRGTCVGGFMNMEDFINGYPGTESGLRRMLAEEIGVSKSELFFESLLDKFFGEKDIVFIKETGANCVRIPLNYRHFESDDKPFEYKAAGFKRLDETIALCEKHGLYVILDLHAVAGWQNCHWHSDNERGLALLWTHEHFKERMIAFWEEMARRYKNSTTVAGYNLVNEPSCGNVSGEHGFDFYECYQSDWDAINSLYKRLVKAIRAIDNKHIIFLEGDYYSRLFSGLDEPFDDNLVYSSHNYIAPGYGPGAYPGYYGKTYWDKNKVKADFLNQEGTKFAKQHQVPLWVGEFGSQYHGSEADLPSRIASINDQISLYNDMDVHWTTWTYKDPGIMGWVCFDPESEYMKIIAPIQQMKKDMGAENFVALYEGQSKGKEIARTLSDYILDASGNTDLNYDSNAYTMNYTVLTGYAAATLQRTYVKLFNGYSEDDIERITDAFAFENCMKNEAYLKLLRERLAD